jgi:hypothetical protein
MGKGKIRCAVLVAAVMAVAVAGCGGDDDGDDGARDPSADRTAIDRAPSLTAFCERVEGFQSSPDPGAGDLDAIKKGFRELRAEIDGLAGVAPSQIEDDVESLRSAYSSVADRVERAQTTQNLVAAIEELGNRQNELVALTERIQSFAHESC